MKIQGKLLEKFDAKTTKSFTKREFVLEYAENPLYPQTVLFQLAGDKIALIEEYQKGENLEVEFNIQGRSWTAPDGEVKYFNTLEAWRLKRV